MGSGFRTFTAGEVLSASNVQNFLMDQSVMVFAGTAARSSAIGTANFEEGMLTYLTDVDKLQVYTGASFADVYPAATVTPGLVQIGTAISFSGVASFSLPADTFTSTYKNYRLLFQLSSASTILTITSRLRAGGSDNSVGVYNQMSTGITQLAGGSNRTENNTTSWTIQAAGSAGYWGLVLDVLNPKTATATQIQGLLTADDGATFVGRNVNAIHNSTTSFDSMSFIASTGNFTGTVSVMGYNA